MVYACFAGYIKDSFTVSSSSSNQSDADLSYLDMGIPWAPCTLSTWTAIFMFVLMVAWARVFLGCHYPSCCLSGMCMGIGIHFMALFIARIHYEGCECYFPKTSEETKSNISSKAGYIVGFGLPLAAVFELVLGLSFFWEKSTHALGLLLPPLIFIIAFLCPKISGHSELHVAGGSPDESNIVTAFASTVLLSGIGFATQIKHPLTASDYFRFAAFLFLMVLSLMALVATRLIQREEDGKTG
jgi:uncharacterized membrane protein (DUF485 family)